ncbi:unnamed protein product [Ostreobium quekettii]|uniref:Tryptophan synthase beta chain-like PALP domain-containing protein n=1 Tax=Ostreobium quekettii TaxID=121088 RepID=A0A8S1J0N5_9CHLO|nr:unnamed protein product [Ostreobium quekettii]|eukprot:evm.model.scf_26.20 EVM.evm.TU.scf_26.20   scf_26:164731-170937(+)
MRRLLKAEPYLAPPWAQKLKAIPRERYCLGLLPTPVHKWKPKGVPGDLDLWIKRDDLSGVSLSGNKVRKLEFLLADAKAKGHDCVITIGGIQSNHCRATAVAARYLDLDSHLILRNNERAAQNDPGLVGNLLVERMVGATIHQVTKAEYQRVGSEALVEQLAQQLKADGRNPYVIPVGGSNSLGTWGYLECVNELQAQVGGEGFTDIVVACGSGATTGGTALGVLLSGWQVEVHSYGVCDDEDYFYDFIDGLYAGLGATKDVIGKDSRSMFQAIQAKGAGYALSREEELHTVQEIALSTGVVLDPVYSGKAAHCFFEDVRTSPAKWSGKKVLFIHTGGLLGMYDKTDQLQPMVEALDRHHRLQVPS